VYGKEKVAQAPGRPKPFRYIVYIGTDTLELVDSAALMKFDSDATFNRLEVGKKYNVHIAAWHWQMFSHHRAILKVD
jgi:hypothetical protein